ncbi:MAG: Na/Pi symporter [Planctomycetes bacterium]|nr:Na/Pi symporter [Planctomycetota bacterium]MCB9903813.1 Na/Pi symporter [Planctomycetota bacterium]
MNGIATAPSERPEPPTQLQRTLGVLLRVALVLLLLYFFLVAIQMMGGSIKMMGKDASEGLFAGVNNPFAGLAVGILATVLVQSSSTTTSTIVALVGGGSLTVEQAVPMIMGANIGTTITNTLVSIGHIRKSMSFRRAFAAATVHDFFNLLCVIVLLPLEIAFGFLAHSAEWLTSLILGAPGAESAAHGGVHYDSPIKVAVKTAFKALQGLLQDFGFEGTSLAVAILVIGIALTFTCLILITKNMRTLVSGPLEHALNRSLGKSGLIGIVIGILVTAAVQSSSITTSLLVPLCAAGILSLENAFPIMLGANIGTTITAMLASLGTDERGGLTIALVHLCFNLCGVLLFYPIKRLRRIPIQAARFLANKASENPFWVLGYVAGVFIVMPLLGWWAFGKLQ